jgi:N-acetylglutamate synthase-like GNAT family acetyltransferase
MGFEIDGSAAGVTLRTDLKPGDLGRIVSMHGLVYAREYGFDRTFEAYVAGPLAQCVLSASGRDRIWLAEREGRLVGSVAVVAASPLAAQLRWFLVEPAERGQGIGRALLRAAVAFGEEYGYESIFLWTVSALATAAHLYQAFGFRRVESAPARRWGVDVVEEKYELALPSPKCT